VNWAWILPPNVTEQHRQDSAEEVLYVVLVENIDGRTLGMPTPKRIHECRKSAYNLLDECEVCRPAAFSLRCLAKVKSWRCSRRDEWKVDSYGTSQWETRPDC
jgi:hypothetical protein